MDDPFNLSFLDDFDDDDKHQNDFSHRTDIPESEVMLHLEDLNLSNDLISYLNEQEIFRIDHLFKLNKDFFSSLIYNLGDEAVRQLFDNIAIHEIDIPNLNQIYLQLQNDMYPNGMKSIDEMIGIAAVKEQMKNFTAHCSIQKLKNEFYGREKSLIPNMIFYGNPGTGKTTAAKLVAKKFKELGLLPKGHLVSVTRSDLVAEYTGQSAQKTTSVFKSAIGGVLFIDEAYSLFHQLNHNHYGDVFSLEVIDTLTGLITVNAGRICVILAGYEEEMTFMLEKANPGLKERFPFKFYFEDYTVVELVEIFKLQAKKNNLCIEHQCFPLLTDIFKKLSGNKKMQFANGRLVENLLQEVTLYQERRLFDMQQNGLELTNSELMTLRVDDFIRYTETLEHRSVRDINTPMGFAVR